jgi:hypothetical protein
MSENLVNHVELTPDIQTFTGLINRKVGKLQPEESVSFTEPSSIARKHHDHRYICEVTSSPDPDQPYNINLWNYVSPIWYDKEEYTFDTVKGLYMRSGVSAEPDILETVPPFLTEWKTRPATAIDLGRVVGILEYLEKDTSDNDAPIEITPKLGSQVARWILGRKQ